MKIRAYFEKTGLVRVRWMFQRGGYTLIELLVALGLIAAFAVFGLVAFVLVHFILKVW